MKLQSITNKQKIILLFLYKFRFVTANQLQKYFKHKDPHRVKEWLKDLKNKKYISAIVDSKDITKPYIYCLATYARQTLIENNCHEDYLNRVYKERRLTNVFKNHCLFIVNIYLFFRSQQKKNSILNFCTQQDLNGFDYLPKDLDAYIEVKDHDEVNRYFLELFDEYRKSTGEGRYAIRKYISYSEEGNWQANTNNSPLPSILIVQSDERRKKHIEYYGKAKLEKTFENISIFQTTQNAISFSKSGQNIWQKVE